MDNLNQDKNNVDFTGATPRRDSYAQSDSYRGGSQTAGRNAGSTAAQIERDRAEDGQFGEKPQSAAEAEIYNRAAKNAKKLAKRGARSRKLQQFGYKAKKTAQDILAGSIVTVLALGVVGGVTATRYIPSTPESNVCTVDDKDRTTTSKGASSMRIYMTCDGEESVKEVRDAWFRGQWDSADRYHDLEIGETYKIETIGLRVPIINLFPNIVESTPVTAN